MNLNNFLTKSINSANSDLHEKVISSVSAFKDALNQLKEFTDDELNDEFKNVEVIEKIIPLQGAVYSIIHNLSLEKVEYNIYKNFLFIRAMDEKTTMDIVNESEGKIDDLESKLKNKNPTGEIIQSASVLFNLLINLQSRFKYNLNQFTLKNLIMESKTNNKFF